MQSLDPLLKKQFHTDGYIVLDGLLSAEEVTFFNKELDRIRMLPGYEPDNDPKFNIGHYSKLNHAKDLRQDGFMDRRELLDYGKDFIKLIDRAPGFDYIVDLMGSNIMLSMTQAIVRPPTEKFSGYTHTDGGESMRMTRVAAGEQPIAVKIMYMLSDSLEEDSGNLTVFPGSHVIPIPHEDQTITPYSHGSLQLKARAGDAVIFTHSLWHGPSMNLSNHSRRLLLYNYCQMWVRTYDSAIMESVLKKCTPRQRRLCGDLGYDFRPGSYFYVPVDQEEVIRD